MDSTKHKKNYKVRRRVSMLLGIGVSVGCIIWLFSAVESQKVVETIKSVSIPHILLAAFITALSYIIRAYRWRFLFSEQSLTMASSYRCLILGFFFNNVLPARIGEFARAHLGGKASGQSRAYVLATIASERLADGVTISALFAILFSLGASDFEREQAKEVFLVAKLFGIAALITALALYFRKYFLSVLESINQKLPWRVSQYGVEKTRLFIAGLEPLLEPKRLGYIALLSLLVWCIEFLVYWVVADAYSYDMSIAGLILFLAAVNFSSLIPAAPGGLGVIETIATFALVHFGVNSETALAMVFTQHAIQITVVGFPGMYFFFSRLGGKMPEEEAEGVVASGIESVGDTTAS